MIEKWSSRLERKVFHLTAPESDEPVYKRNPSGTNHFFSIVSRIFIGFSVLLRLPGTIGVRSGGVTLIDDNYRK